MKSMPPLIMMPPPNRFPVTIGELINGYENTVDAKPGESGPGHVVALGGKLIVRPSFQRNFIYSEAEQQAVIDTVSKGFPLNVMYWGVNADGDYEMIDGQQRTIAICEFCVNKFFGNKGLFGISEPKKFRSLGDNQQTILDYPLMVYLCEGTEDQRLDWFRTINIAGKALSDQELLNAVYRGTWTTDAKQRFGGSKTRGYRLGNRFVGGNVNRQEYVAAAIRWAAYAEGEKYAGNDAVKKYMEDHRYKESAEPLEKHFKDVINWVQTTFPIDPKRKDEMKEMKKVDWGRLYHEHHERDLGSDPFGDKIAKLMQDEEVQRKHGIYEFVLTDNEKHLNLRIFDEATKRTVFERQGRKCNNKKCPKRGEELHLSDMHADHKTAWSKGGKTSIENCQMLCVDCNLGKGNG
ncbi:MAG: HNH endonuclease family protein [bacterium]